MVDRLAELRRQRALICEHLAWLDREIGRVESSSPPSTAATSATAESPVIKLDDGSRPLTVPKAPEASEPGQTDVADAEATRLLEEYRPTATALKNDVRKGCVLYFVAAFVLLALGVAALYLLIGSR